MSRSPWPSFSMCAKEELCSLPFLTTPHVVQTTQALLPPPFPISSIRGLSNYKELGQINKEDGKNEAVR